LYNQIPRVTAVATRRKPPIDLAGLLAYSRSVADKPGVHLLVRLIWKVEQLRGRFVLPVGKLIGGLLFYGRPLLSNAWGVLMQALVREPAFRYRCARVGRGLRLYGSGPHIMGDGRIEIGDSVEFNANTVLLVGLGLSGGARLSVGNDVRFGPDNMIVVARELRIGDHCRTGPGVKIYDTDMHALDADSRRQNYGTIDQASTAAVRLEDDVWIGANAVILKGVTLHRGAIVGAGAVVTSDVAPFTIVAGNPAQVVRGLAPMPSVPAPATAAPDRHPSE
jgi:acetyltransferase-like isoleucine patch superfamily enzyme